MYGELNEAHPMVLIKLSFLTKDYEQSIKIQKEIFCQNVEISFIKVPTKTNFRDAVNLYNHFDLIYSIRENDNIEVKNAIV